MKKLVKTYGSLRESSIRFAIKFPVNAYTFDDSFFFVGKDKNSNNCKFWDVVVITTADNAQKRVFELQIESKRKRNELPLNLPIYVVADPPGPKIGVMLILALLAERKIYG